MCEAEPLCLHTSIFPSFALISMCGFILPYIISSGNLFGSGLLERPVNKHIMGITTGNLCDGSVLIVEVKTMKLHANARRILFQRSSAASRSQP